MSTTRLHDKFHRQNHHTYTSNVNPDAGHDPIASSGRPFRGDFNLSGALSASCPLSAVAGSFSSNNAGLFVSGLSGVTAYSSSAGSYNLAGDINRAALYCYAYAPDPGPWASINFGRGYIPKALVVDGYSDFRFPMYAQSIASPYVQVTTLSAVNVNTVGLSANTARFTSLTATTLNVTTLNFTTSTASTVSATSFTAPTIDTASFTASASRVTGRGAVIVRSTPSSTIPKSTWTLVPMTSAQWNPFNWYTAFGTASADKPGLCLCEFTAVAHPVTGTPLGIIGSVTTNSFFNTVGASDAVSPFTGTSYFTNNGVTVSTLSNVTGVSGVAFQGTTLVSTNGVGEQIGCYFFNPNGQTVVDYCRLRVIYLGLITP